MGDSRCSVNVKTYDALVETLQIEGRRYTPIATRHSWGLNAQGACLISLQHFNNIEMLDGNIVRVQAGVTFEQLQDFLSISYFFNNYLCSCDFFSHQPIFFVQSLPSIRAM